MPVNLPPSAWLALSREGNDALRNKWHAAGLGPGSGEVVCIRNLIQEGVPKLNAAWTETLAKHNIQSEITGALCHPIPQVMYAGAARACELGDILIVHDHSPDGGAPERRACIIQAKIFGRRGVTSRNDIQKGLYQNWPEFRYTRWPGGLDRLERLLHRHAGFPRGVPGALSRHLNRSVPGGRIAPRDEVDSGSRYAMIDFLRMHWNFPFQSSPWRVCSANVRDLYTHQRGPTLPGYLLRMLRGDAGRDAPEIAWPRDLASACHWSLMVNELMHALPLHGGSTVAPAGTTSFIAGGPATGNPGSDVEQPEGEFGVISITTSGSPSGVDRAEPERER